MKITRSSAFLAGYYICLLGWWVLIQFYKVTDQSINIVFAFSYGLIPLLGGGLGLFRSKDWGFLKSVLGKALFFFSLGLITWGIGECIWSYYTIFLKVEIPYPSWSDAGFIISWPLWAIGVYHLSHATGAKYGLKRTPGQLFLFILPILIAIISYYLLVIVARSGSITSGGGPLKIFFDLAYPIGDAIVLTIALLVYGLSFKYLGGRFKWPVIITLFGFIFNYAADFGFSYTTTVGTFYNGGLVDLLFTTAMFVLSFGINSFATKDE
ncbi:MAG TPA: hypothetical protein VLF89_02955 [Candidatus Saccharimonadales bacterium]|nr:hypothetical protein [Candidatus Saccharimonadales bacterium]